MMRKKIALNLFSMFCSAIACTIQIIFLLPIDHSPLMLPMLIFVLGPSMFCSVYINKKQLHFSKEDNKDPRLNLISNLSAFFSALFFCLLTVNIFKN